MFLTENMLRSTRNLLVQMSCLYHANREKWLEWKHGRWNPTLLKGQHWNTDYSSSSFHTQKECTEWVNCYCYPNANKPEQFVNAATHASINNACITCLQHKNHTRKKTTWLIPQTKKMKQLSSWKTHASFGKTERNIAAFMSECNCTQLRPWTISSAK